MGLGKVTRMTSEPPVGVVGGLPWRPERLRAERRVNPLGVDTAHPWLDWRLPAGQQTPRPPVTGCGQPHPWLD